MYFFNFLIGTSLGALVFPGSLGPVGVRPMFMDRPTSGHVLNNRARLPSPASQTDDCVCIYAHPAEFQPARRTTVRASMRTLQTLKAGWRSVWLGFAQWSWTGRLLDIES